jgi:predicted Zn-dependent protease
VKSKSLLLANPISVHPATRPRGLPSVLLAAVLSVQLVLMPSLSLAQTPQNGIATPVLPNLGDTEREDLSPLQERKLGEEIMRDIRRDPDYLDDAPLLEYLDKFGNGLVAARPEARGEAGYDFFFFAVRDPVLNAFALPGGFIAVHSGLLLAAQTESELASVMAHEIGHVAQRHIARGLGKQRQDALIPLASLLLAVLAARANTGADAPIALLEGGQALAIQRQLNFSRDAEREADRVGFQILRDANFDTSGMVAFFGRLQTASRSYNDTAPAFLRSHPLTTERIADIQARVRDQRYKQRVDSLDFHLIRARVRVLQDTSAQGLHEAAEFFDNQLLQKNWFQTAAAKYGLALIALKQGAPGKATALLQESRNAAQHTLMVTPGVKAPVLQNTALTSFAIDIKLAPSQSPEVIKQAVTEAESAHSQFPLSRGIARQYADALLAAGRNDDAARYLRDQIQLYREEPQLQDQLAKTYAAQGKLALQHMALAESYVLAGSVPAALDQLSLARKAPDASFYDQAVIDARERELQLRRKEELKDGKDNKGH